MYGSCEKEPRTRADFELNTSQQCDMTAKKAKVIFTNDRRSTVSRARESQLSFPVFLVSCAGPRTSRAMDLCLRVILTPESNSMTESDREGKGQGKQVLRTRQSVKRCLLLERG